MQVQFGEELGEDGDDRGRDRSVPSGIGALFAPNGSSGTTQR
ncbi:MAG: hypothetical protein OXG55_03115 [bacterium]|nr:hypothetical protein [bacterium]